MLSSTDGRPVYAGEDEDDDNLDDDEIDDEDLEDDDTSSSNPAEVTVAIAQPLTPARSSAGVVTIVTSGPENRPIAAFEDSRKLFQRLFTDEDEIQLLQGFLEYTGGAYVSKNMDTAPFYDQIRNKLHFNKNQLVEKLRRLKKKYRTVMGKINSGKDYVFKSPHEQERFEISKKIWCEPATRVIEYEEYNNHNPISFSFNPSHFVPVDLNSKGSTPPKKRARPIKSEEAAPQFCQPISQVAATPVAANPMPGLIEETVKSCLTPIFKELVKNVTSSSKGFAGIGGLSHVALSFGGLGPLGGGDISDAMEEKWRKQQILELEVYSKRLELVQDQIKLAMEELRSKDS